MGVHKMEIYIANGSEYKINFFRLLKSEEATTSNLMTLIILEFFE